MQPLLVASATRLAGTRGYHAQFLHKTIHDSILATVVT